jgi:ABC-type polysaccharide/polyol phosphate export permease
MLVSADHTDGAIILSIIRQRNLILDMCFTELRRKYAGTLLGPIWAIAPQILTVAAYWFVFQYGLKVKGSGSLPYFYYFTLGILPWFLFFDSFSSNVNSVLDNKHLITKMVFPSEILTVVTFLVASVPHFVLVSLLSAMLWSKDLLSPTHTPWLLYFYGCAAILSIGLGWLISSISVFARDAAHMAPPVVSLLFWITPIMWQVEALPATWQWAFEWNPLMYVVNGYRFALTGGTAPSWEANLKFWVVALAAATFGRYIFSRLKHHFADVL